MNTCPEARSQTAHTHTHACRAHAHTHYPNPADLFVQPVDIASIVLDMVTDPRIKMVRFNRRPNVVRACDGDYKFDGVDPKATKALFGLHAHPGLDLHNEYTRTPVLIIRLLVHMDGCKALPFVTILHNKRTPNSLDGPVRVPFCILWHDVAACYRDTPR